MQLLGGGVQPAATPGAGACHVAAEVLAAGLRVPPPVLQLCPGNAVAYQPSREGGGGFQSSKKKWTSQSLIGNGSATSATSHLGGGGGGCSSHAARIGSKPINLGPFSGRILGAKNGAHGQPWPAQTPTWGSGAKNTSASQSARTKMAKTIRLWTLSEGGTSVSLSGRGSDRR